MIQNIQAMRGIASLMVFLIRVLVTRGAMGVDGLAWFYTRSGPLELTYSSSSLRRR
jgi:hypothetical protein